jgi:hypothetical protein
LTGSVAKSAKDAKDAKEDQDRMILLGVLGALGDFFERRESAGAGRPSHVKEEEGARNAMRRGATPCNPVQPIHELCETNPI